MGIDTKTLAVAKKYTKDTIEGAGAVKGKPCQIDSITDITGGHRVTFLWLDNSGTSHTSIMDVMDGEKGDTGDKGDKGDRGNKGDTGNGIVSVTQVSGEAQIIIEYTDGTFSDPIDIPTIQGEKGDTGDTPTVEVGTTTTVAYTENAEVTSEDTATGIKLNFKIPQGRPGSGGGGSGSVNSVNNKTPDANGNVEINKADLSLGNVDNTSDENKPISTAQAAVNESFDDRIKSLEENPVNPMQFAEMPTASEHPQEVVQYIGATDANYTRGYFYRSTPRVIEGNLSYAWERIDTQPSSTNYADLSNKPDINGVELTGSKTNEDLGIQGKLQYSTLPEASAANLGKIVQYIGSTTTSLHNGYFYQCIYDNMEYKWSQQNTGTDSDVEARVTANERHIGDMSDLALPQTNLVDCINALNRKDLKTVSYVEPNLILTYNDDSTFSFSLLSVFQQTEVGELSNVLDSTIQDTNILQYDSALNAYKPYAIVTVLSNLLNEAKAYTDQAVEESIVAGAYVCDEKPEYDADNDTVIYKQDGVTKTTTQTDARFYYHDSNDDSYCTSWINDIEFTFSVAEVQFEDYVKVENVVSNYTGQELDKTKIPNLAALDALVTLVRTTYLSDVLHETDVIDNLNSVSTTKPLSANQGKELKALVDAKQDIMQYATMPTASLTYVGKVAQYVGGTLNNWVKGRFYQCDYDSETDTYSWNEIRYNAVTDSALSQSSENPVQNKVINAALNGKIDKTDKGAANGVAELDSTGKVPAGQLPDLLELGETSDKAYRGDRGKAAYDHSEVQDGTNPHGTTANNVNLSSPISVDGVSKSTVEAAVDAINTLAALLKGGIDDITILIPTGASSSNKLVTEDNVLTIPSGSGAKNMIYRGQSLGSSFTAEQQAEIAAGTFNGLFLGDYWTINSVNWRIAAFNYWINTGDTACTTPHIVIVPDTCLLAADGSTTHYMNSTNDTSNGYTGTDFYKGTNSNTAKAQCRTKAQNAFGSAHILTHREYLTNKVTNGKPSGGEWKDSDIEMMNEIMVYGCPVFLPANDGSTVPNLYTIDKTQLPLFRARPDLIGIRANWWLRDAVSGSYFALVGDGGNCGSDHASAAWVGVRPAFGIC
jgi:hypothetical protein